MLSACEKMEGRLMLALRLDELGVSIITPEGRPDPTVLQLTQYFLKGSLIIVRRTMRGNETIQMSVEARP